MGWYHVANSSQMHDQPMSIQTTSKERAAARRDCQAGTLSPDFECKRRFIIRLFFWVILPVPWLHWIKIKPRYFTNHPPILMQAAAWAPQQEEAPSWREACRKAVLLGGWVPHWQTQPANCSPRWEGCTDTQLAPPATAHTAEPGQGKAESDRLL